MIRYIFSIKPFLKKNDPYRKNAHRDFFDKVSLSKLNENQTLKCEGAECELLKALSSMDNDESPGNDGITKEFYIKI